METKYAGIHWGRYCGVYGDCAKYLIEMCNLRLIGRNMLVKEAMLQILQHRLFSCIKVLYSCIRYAYLPNFITLSNPAAVWWFSRYSCLSSSSITSMSMLVSLKSKTLKLSSIWSRLLALGKGIRPR